MEGMQLLALLEERYGVTLPQDLLFEDDTTLHALAVVLKAGGRVAPRPVLVDGAALAAREADAGADDAATLAGKRERLRQERLRAASAKPSLQTGKFAPGAFDAAPMGAAEQRRAGLALALLVAGPAVLLAPLALALVAFVALRPSSAADAARALALALALVLVSPPLVARRARAAFARSRARALALRFFSFRVLFETALAKDEPLVVCLAQRAGPNPSVALAGLAALFDGVFGAPLTALVPGPSLGRAGSGHALRALGCRARAPGALGALLDASAAVCVGCAAPDGGAGEDGADTAEAVRVAMQKGASLVPALALGEPAAPSTRAAVLVVLGAPIALPHTSDPSAELVREYHEQLVAATRALPEFQRKVAAA